MAARKNRLDSTLLDRFAQRPAWVGSVKVRRIAAGILVAVAVLLFVDDAAGDDRVRVVTAGRDLTAQRAIISACIAMAVILLLDLADGNLGLLFSVGFVLIVITAPLSVDVGSLLPTGVLPPVLLICSLFAVCLFEPSALRLDGLADDASTLARLIAATIDHGATLAIGYGLALGIIALRVVSAPPR